MGTSGPSPSQHRVIVLGDSCTAVHVGSQQQKEARKLQGVQRRAMRVVSEVPGLMEEERVQRSGMILDGDVRTVSQGCRYQAGRQIIQDGTSA